MATGSTGAKTTQAKAEQRELARRVTLEMFKDRKSFEVDYEFELDGEKVSIHMKAIGSVAYDKLVDACPATKEQIAENASFDQPKFMPLLLSKVVTDPVLTQAEWRTLLTEAENYGRGEVGELFYTAVNVCNRNLGLTLVGPTEPV